MQHVKIFDTTLRDGQQCPGAGMTFAQNIEYAQLAAKIKVDILEAGFPSASQQDFKIVHAIASMYAHNQTAPQVAALSQLRTDQVEKTIQALEPLIPSNRGRLHVYLPVSPALMTASLGTHANNKTLLLNETAEMIKLGMNAGLEVEFSPEGYSRMGENFDFVTDLISAAIEAGASVINCPDTIGGACYLQKQNYFVAHMKIHAQLMKNLYPQRDICWSVHCHNDYGLALDNSMRAVFDGPATQIEGCFNGVGERAGNVALEQCLMYIKNFGNAENGGKKYYTQAQHPVIREISDFVDKHMLQRQPHWPISGSNAAKHSSGGHTNAILKNTQAYQPFDPSEVGQGISFVFGPLSGSNHAQAIIHKQGYVCEPHERHTITQWIKEYSSDRRKGLTDEEFMKAYYAYRQPIKVAHFEYTHTTDQNVFKMQCHIFDEEQEIVVHGHSDKTALTALHHSLEQRFQPFSIESYRSESKERGRDAISYATISIAYNNHFYSGKGYDQNIEISALKALIDAVNQALIDSYYSQQQSSENQASKAVAQEGS
ncbi:alpha-isopropylmalate synthase regulatory domain-containing protein [Marinicella sp. W31]|uniref:homocitrate synthase/isopropylmalate synthase family protein n=1 Tax=Marinicella sp. W31 TaxID=3023713 RepID=UPI00375636B2